MAPSGTPSSIFKHAINLNRYETGVSKKLILSYNRILLEATKELQVLRAADAGSSYRAKRLQKIIGTLKTSLDGWAGNAAQFMTKDLTELALIESEFAAAQLQQLVPDADNLIRELEISPEFAKAVVTKDPTELNLVTTEVGDTLTGKGVYKLTAKQGAPMVLPNGDTVEKAFRGIATSSAQKFRLVVQDGMLTGLSTDKIVRQIIGKQGGMRFAKGQNVSARAIALAGGEKGTRLANNQIMTLVRTSVNQVSNTASQETYKANSAVTNKYRYVATLDSRTTVLCASKDGKLFDYEEGPMPPLHFNCRSTTVPVIDWDGLEKDYGIIAPDKVEGVGQAKRASKDGPVPANEKYGDWLYSKRVKEGRKVLPGPEQIDALGYDKAVYFNRLAARYKDPNKAIVSLVREDGTEKTLADLRRDYKFKKVEKAIKVATKEIQEKMPTMGGLQGFNSTSKINQNDVDEAFKLMTEMEGEAGANAKKLVRFAEQREVFATWSTGKEITRRGKGPGYGYLLSNPQFRKSLEKGLERGNMGYTDATNRTLLGMAREKYQSVLNDIKGTGTKSGLISFGQRALKGNFTMYKHAGCGGYTFVGSNHIVMRNSPRFRKIKDLKEIITSVKEGVKLAAKNNPGRYSDTSKNIARGPFQWLTTYVHEMGHQVHYAAKKPMLGLGEKGWPEGVTGPITPGSYIPSTYGGSNNMEQFAETFVQYIFDPVGLRKTSPEAYSWIERAVQAALKAK